MPTRRTTPRRRHSQPPHSPHEASFSQTETEHPVQSLPNNWYPQGISPQPSGTWTPGNTMSGVPPGMMMMGSNPMMMQPNSCGNCGACGNCCPCCCGAAGMNCANCGNCCGTCCMGCGMNGMALDPYCCPAPMPGQPSCLECFYSCCDWTFVMMFLVFVGYLVGLIVIIVSGNGDIIKYFDVTDATELESAIQSMIKWKNESKSDDGKTPPCTTASVIGSGTLCLEQNLNANVFVSQLGYWNTSQMAMYAVAVVISFIALVYAILVNIQRRQVKNSASLELTPQKQEEFMKMSPMEQQTFMAEYQQALIAQQSGGCCSCCGVEVYDTPFYEFMRMAWLGCGIAALGWGVSLLMSVFTYSSFYSSGTSGKLNSFWGGFTNMYLLSVVLALVMLAWPIVNPILEFAVWLIGLLPWLLIRCTCKQGVERFRPALPLSQLPGCIRTDMFFMDFQDLKRLGFSRQSWVMLTGSEMPFFNSCCCAPDPTVDRDPEMTALNAMRMQWQQQMYGMMMPGMNMSMSMGMMPPTMPPVMTTASTSPTIPMATEELQKEVTTKGSGEHSMEKSKDNDELDKRGSRVKSRRMSHSHGRSRSHHNHEHNRSRRHSRRGEGASRSGSPPPHEVGVSENKDVPDALEGSLPTRNKSTDGSRSHHHHHAHDHHRSRRRSASGKGGHRRRHSVSRHGHRDVVEEMIEAPPAGQESPSAGAIAPSDAADSV